MKKNKTFLKNVDSNYMVVILLLIIVVLVIATIWYLQDFFILLLFLLTIIVFCVGPEQIIQNVRHQKAKEAENRLPLHHNFLLTVCWELLNHLIDTNHMSFNIEPNQFHMDALQNSQYKNQGSTYIARVHVNMNTQAQDEYLLTEVAQQYLAYQQQTPLGQQNSLLQRVLLESICIKNGFLEFTFHDKNFYVQPRDASNNLKDSYYG